MSGGIDDGYSEGVGQPIIGFDPRVGDQTGVIIVGGDISPGRAAIINAIKDGSIPFAIIDDPLCDVMPLEPMIYELPERHELPMSKSYRKRLAPISVKNRKNWMRNHLCSCGSGKKFKHCCWSKRRSA